MIGKDEYNGYGVIREVNEEELNKAFEFYNEVSKYCLLHFKDKQRSYDFKLMTDHKNYNLNVDESILKEYKETFEKYKEMKRKYRHTYGLIVEGKADVE